MEGENQFAEEVSNEEKPTLMDEYQEAISSDTERWAAAIESASTPEERKEIIRALLTIGYAQDSITGMEISLSEFGTGDEGDLQSEEAIKNDKKMVNDLCVKYGFPPRYDEAGIPLYGPNAF